MFRLKSSIMLVLAGLSISAILPEAIQAQTPGWVDVKIQVNGGANVFYVGLPNTVEILIGNDLDDICFLNLPFKFDIGRAYSINTAYGIDDQTAAYISAFKKHLSNVNSLQNWNAQNVRGNLDNISPDTLFLYAPLGSLMPSTGYRLCYSASVTILDGEQPLVNGVCVDNVCWLPCVTHLGNPYCYFAPVDTGWYFSVACSFPGEPDVKLPPDYNGVPNSDTQIPDAPPICFDIVPAPAYTAVSQKLPDEACPPWTSRVLNGAPNPVLSGDTLVINTAESAADQLAYYEVVGSSFVPPSGPISIEFKMKYGGGTPSVPARTSASVGISRGGRGNVLWIGPNNIFVWNGLDVVGENAQVDTYSSYHVYRIEVDAAGRDFSVFHDGIRVLNGQLFADASLWGATPTIYWGDATGNSSGNSKWMYFKYNSTYPPCTDAACCIGPTGNVDCDPSDGTDISDLSTLIDYLYISFTPLCCTAEANTDGQPGTDISDLSALIDYLYISFTPPAACQ